ncbi:MAG: ParA family protein [Intrasporangium sp.]|uniref:ParA family protein n=1 Tax=Intrasporangium sp. TaxID=1925024 RepID=UPI0026482F21|nr:ParA family protein [Intrasporangium sp.]MDN5798120.1 ParA family protein [Intrasporangium sp.]
MTTVLGSYSEAGGVCKTTHAVSLAMTAALAGRNVLLIDLDPRASATRWLTVEPTKPGLDVSAIIAADDCDGWADELAVPAPDGWSPNLRVVPAGRRLATLEGQLPHGVELRLMRAIEGTTADLVVIDCPNRQGGPLTLNALFAANALIIAAKPDTDGREGVEGAYTTIARHRQTLDRLGSTRRLDVLGIVVGNGRDVIVPRIEKHTLAELDNTWPGQVLRPVIPSRTIVREAREAGTWYGNFPSSAPVVEAYAAIAAQILHTMKEPA